MHLSNDYGVGIYEVADIEEAVELAYKLKAEGRYNWFRGQVRDWPPKSSLYRVWESEDSERKKWADRSAKGFFNWVGTIPELHYLKAPEHAHDCEAIMQHYGIPTIYIDFTTDPGVAGFFAADTKSPPTEGKSCIYCLNTDDLMRLWRGIKGMHYGARIELVEINVRNLWRLQAQQGVFLLNNYNLEVHYPMDRILFPYSGYPSSPSRERIFPEHKSPLEQQLDQFFFLLSVTYSSEMMLSLLEEESKARGSKLNTISFGEGWPEGFRSDAFIDPSRLVSYESWSHEEVRLWEIAPEENYFQTIGPTLKLELKPQASTVEIRASVSFGVKQILRSDPTCRFKTVDWVCNNLPASLSQEELSIMFRLVWNGMRRLPYTDDEIASAFGAIAALKMEGLGKDLKYNGEMVFSRCFGKCMRIGFTSLDGSGSEGLVTEESLQRAIRPDIAELLAPKYKDYVNDFDELFLIIHKPRLMFEFNEFKSIFAREIIPAQVVLQRRLILFNPAQLKIFGLP